MGFQYSSDGPNSLAAFTLPGIPFVTSSVLTAANNIHHITFPCATTFLMVRVPSGTGLHGSVNSEDSIASVAFSENGLKTVFHNHFTLSIGTTLTLNLRVKELWISATQDGPAYEIIAGMSTCPWDRFPVLTASNGDYFRGVG